MDLSKIISFEAKRNCAITLLLSANNNYQKSISQIERKISAMKNESKRKQLKLVIDKLKKESKKIQNLTFYKSKGLIICCGLSNIGELIEYFQFEPTKIIYENEYFYDYKFNINLIFEKLYETIEFANFSLNDLNKLREKELIIFKKEINENIYEFLSYIIYLSDDFIDQELCNNSIKYKFKIKILKEENNDSIKLQYGDMVGVLYYKY